MIRITRHANERSRERLNLNRKAIERQARRAFERGLKREELSGDLLSYLNSLVSKHRGSKNLRIFAEKVFVFAEDIFVTVFPLPTQYRKIAIKLNRRKKAGLSHE